MNMRYFIPFLLLFSSSFLNAMPNATMSSNHLWQESYSKAIRDPLYIESHNIDLPSSPPVTAKTVHLSLKQAVYLALRYNPNIQSQALDRVLQRLQLRVIQRHYELNYALSGQATWQKARVLGVKNDSDQLSIEPGISTTLPLGTEVFLGINNNFSNRHYEPRLALNLKQPLLRGFGKAMTMQPLNDQIDREFINQRQLKQNIIDTITNVILNYRRLIEANNLLITAEKALKEANRNYQVNKKKIAAGQLAPTANVQQAYQIASLKLQLSQQKNAWLQTKLELIQLLGLSPKLKIKVPMDISLKRIIVPDLAKTIKTAFRNNTYYQNLLTQYRIDKRAYQVAKNHKLWQLDLFANFNEDISVTSDTPKSTVPIINSNNYNHSLSLKLTVPIEDYNIKQQFIQAKLNLEKDKIQLEAFKRQLVSTLTNATANIESIVSQYELAKQQLKLAQKSYDLELKKQGAGIASSLDVTNTQNQLISASNHLISVKIQYLNSMTLLEKLLGTTLKTWQLKVQL